MPGEYRFTHEPGFTRIFNSVAIPSFSLFPLSLFLSFQIEKHTFFIFFFFFFPVGSRFPCRKRIVSSYPNFPALKSFVFFFPSFFFLSLSLFLLSFFSHFLSSRFSSFWIGGGRFLVKETREYKTLAKNNTRNAQGCVEIRKMLHFLKGKKKKKERERERERKKEKEKKRRKKGDERPLEKKKKQERESAAFDGMATQGTQV